MTLTDSIQAFDLDGYLAGFETKKAGQTERTMSCPSCAKGNLSISTSNKVMKCWSCGLSGGLVDLMALLDGSSKRDAAQRIMKATPNAPRAIRDKRVKPSTGWGEIAPPPGTQYVKEELPYLKKRGITLGQASRYGLGWVAKGRTGQRLVFPVFERERLVFWQARAMFESDAENHIKTLNPARQSGCAGSSDVIFGLSVMDISQTINICEGPIDAIHAEGVCVFGKRLSPAQIQLLTERGVKRVNVMLDSDAGEEAMTMASKLTSFFDTFITELPEGDPGDYSTEWLKSHIAENMRPAFTNRKFKLAGALS